MLNQNMMSGLVMLSELYLESNRIVSIEDHTFKNMAKLRSLQLYSNNLTYIRKYTFSGLINMQALDISRNILSYIHNGSFIDFPTSAAVDTFSNLIPCSCSYVRMLSSYNFDWQQSDCRDYEPLSHGNFFRSEVEIGNGSATRWTPWFLWRNCGSCDGSFMRLRPCLSCRNTNNPMCVDDGMNRQLLCR